MHREWGSYSGGVLPVKQLVSDESGTYTLAEWVAKGRHEQQIALLTEIRDLLKIVADALSAKPL